MGIFETIINWLTPTQWATLAGALGTILTVIVARTPTKKDDKLWNRIKSLFGKDKLDNE